MENRLSLAGNAAGSRPDRRLANANLFISRDPVFTVPSLFLGGVAEQAEALPCPLVLWHPASLTSQNSCPPRSYSSRIGQSTEVKIVHVGWFYDAKCSARTLNFKSAKQKAERFKKFTEDAKAGQSLAHRER